MDNDNEGVVEEEEEEEEVKEEDVKEEDVINAHPSSSSSSSLNNNNNNNNRSNQKIVFVPIIDSLGIELTSVLTPVSICMFLTVFLVKILINNDNNNNNNSNNNSMLIATLYYEEHENDKTSEKLFGSFINALIFVTFVTLLTFLLVFLFYKGCAKCIWIYMSFAGFQIFFLLGGIIFLQLIHALNLNIDFLSFLFFLFNFTIVGLLSVFIAPQFFPLLLQQSYLICIGSITAFWFSKGLPEWSTWSLLIIMAIYDCFAVLTPKGPLHLLVHIAEQRQESLPALVYEARPNNNNNNINNDNNNNNNIDDDDNDNTIIINDGEEANNHLRHNNNNNMSSASILHSNQGVVRVNNNHKNNNNNNNNNSNDVNINDNDNDDFNGNGERKVPFLLRGAPKRMRKSSTSNNGKTKSKNNNVNHSNNNNINDGNRFDDNETDEEAQLLHDNNNNDDNNNNSSELEFEVEDRNNNSNITERNYNDNSVKLGLGDFIFYSILMSRAAMFDTLTTFSCYFAIVFGLGITFLLLAIYERALPALPFSIALGAVFYCLTRVFMEEMMIGLTTNLATF